MSLPGECFLRCWPLRGVPPFFGFERPVDSFVLAAFEVVVEATSCEALGGSLPSNFRTGPTPHVASSSAMPWKNSPFSPVFRFVVSRDSKPRSASKR